jgi:hypothetical protein
MDCEVEIPAESIAVAWWKYLKILVFCRFLRALRSWLGGRESLPKFPEPPQTQGFFDKALGASDLAFSDSFVGFRLFASVFRFCPRGPGP